MIFDEEKIDGLIAQCRLAEAAAALTLARAPFRDRAALCAIAGDDRGLARFVDAQLLACTTAAEVAKYYGATDLEPTAEDHLVAGVVLTWTADAAGALDSLRAAHDRAVAHRRFYLGVAARERLAHHALLFGDVELARTAIDEAIAMADAYALPSWLLRSLAAAASLALDAGDLERAGEFLERGRSAARSPEELALLAATGAQLAVELGDDAALPAWTSQQMIETALRCESAEAAAAATAAALIVARTPARETPVAIALRRALLQAAGAASAVELFATAAQYGDLEEARFAAEAFAAMVAPNRPYLHAHQLLARAHLLLRSGERSGWIDNAGDAARAFSAMGMRRWTNEAMRLLVAQEPAGDRRPRGRQSGAVLTGREEQVAQLIRRGARNREVAVALQISEHTVERHVSSILGRLGLRSRWQITDAPKSEES
ncbi:MAG TPA: helix-turn-helix transcriptional regulator [Candidatus Cybelea sp.]|jgi:DNA-binding CsgD family transcriptional regulator|nr:helix-turn-helix transcriptional regulator [Candidatus Cybelea sp.]